MAGCFMNPGTNTSWGVQKAHLIKGLVAQGERDRQDQIKAKEEFGFVAWKERRQTTHGKPIVGLLHQDAFVSI